MSYLNIEITVVENGYRVVLTQNFDDKSWMNQEFVFSSREELYRFIDPLLEIGTAKAGDENG